MNLNKLFLSCKLVNTIIFFVIFLLSNNIKSISQGVAINIDGSPSHHSAIFDISSQDKGILIPRMTELQKNSIYMPTEGLMIYQTDSIEGFWYYNGLQWSQLAGSSQSSSNSISQGTDIGNTPYWDGNQWVVNSSNIFNNGSSVGIGTNSPDLSAVIDINSTTKGILIPRMTSVERDDINAPAEGLMIFNINSKCFESYVLNNWNSLSCPAYCFNPNTPGAIIGTSLICENSDYTYSINLVNNATLYHWTVPSGWTILSGQGSETITVTSGSSGNNGNISVKAANTCGASSESVLQVTSNSFLPVSVSVSANPSGLTCADSNITFTAIPTNGGNNPVFQWKINSVDVGNNSNTYNSSSLLNGDTVECLLTSSEFCNIGSPAISNKIILTMKYVPDIPISGTHNATNSQIIWNWNGVANALGYKYNTINNYNSAIDNGTSLTYTQTGLDGNKLYNLYVWAYNDCGPSNTCILSETTVFLCGDIISVQHIAGSISPVNKNTNYNTLLSSATGSSKCWITKNLGADVEASSVTDASEAASGWYWQFNRTQGYKNDGITLTPSSWTSSYSENSAWLQNNDPCYLLLGDGWRLPTYTEYNNFNTVSGWSNYNNAYNALKFHSAGELSSSNGTVQSRGSYGRYWTNTQTTNTQANYLRIGDNYINMGDSYKYWGFPVRCLKD